MDDPEKDKLIAAINILDARLKAVEQVKRAGQDPVLGQILQGDRLTTEREGRKERNEENRYLKKSSTLGQATPTSPRRYEEIRQRSSQLHGPKSKKKENQSKTSGSTTFYCWLDGKLATVSINTSGAPAKLP